MICRLAEQLYILHCLASPVWLDLHGFCPFQYSYPGSLLKLKILTSSLVDFLGGVTKRALCVHQLFAKPAVDFPPKEGSKAGKLSCYTLSPVYCEFIETLIDLILNWLSRLGDLN